jgi:hypothetical protein
MKKISFYIIAIAALLITACASSSGSSPAKPAGSSGGMDLDAAIKEAAGRMERNIPEGTKIALVSVASSSAQFSEYVINRLEAALVDGGKLVVVDRANLDKVREEQGFQMSGEVDDDSAKSIGRLLGAGAIATGSFTSIGDMYTLALKAINLETATVAVSYPADIARSTRIEALLASGGGAAATASGGRTATGGTSGGQAAAEARVLKNGIYTLNPRPRAREAGGTWCDQYVSKVEVENDFITFYFEDRLQGGSGYGGNVSRWRDQCYLIDLNRPTLRRKVSGNTDHNGWGLKTCIFPYVNSNRFRMETSDYEEYFIAEIIIPDEPDL